jgi:hypothetical protein
MRVFESAATSASEKRHGPTFVSVLALILTAGIWISVAAQPAEKQIAAPLPKLVVDGGAVNSTGRGTNQKVVLAITNWERYSTDMFVLTPGQKLPPNPCARVASRIVVAVYSDRGALLSNCIPILRSTDLGKFVIQVAKGKSGPEFVYAVINDRITGAAYRSNLVSPWTGQIK